MVVRVLISSTFTARFRLLKRVMDDLVLKVVDDTTSTCTPGKL
jgi:hypothetical protein